MGAKSSNLPASDRAEADRQAAIKTVTVSASLARILGSWRRAQLLHAIEIWVRSAICCTSRFAIRVGMRSMLARRNDNHRNGILELQIPPRDYSLKKLVVPTIIERLMLANCLPSL